MGDARARRLPARVPVDPDGFVYSLGPWSGDVGLGDESTLAPLPKEPSAGSAVPAAGS